MSFLPVPTRYLHPLQPLALASLALTPFSLWQTEPASASGAGPSQPTPGPNSISKLNEFAEEPGELPDATPLLPAGWFPSMQWLSRESPEPQRERREWRGH